MRPVICVVFTVCFLLNQAVGQNRKAVDSLRAVLETKTGADRYSPLYELTFEYLDKDNEKALELIGEAEKVALLSGDSLWIVKSKRVRGHILYRLERTQECIPLFETALEIANRNGFDEEVKWICNPFALAYLYRGEFDKAIEKFKQTIEFSEQTKDTASLVFALNNVGVTYYQLESPEKALPYLFRVLEINKMANQSPDMLACINISLCYGYLDRLSESEAYLNKAIERCPDGCSQRDSMFIELASGLLFYRLKDYDRALPYLYHSVSLAKARKDSRLTLDNQLLISKIYVATNQIRKAERSLKEAEKLIDNGAPFPETIVQIYSQFSRVYTKLNDYKRLADYQAKYIHLKDSIFNLQLTTRLMTAEAEFRQRENIEKIKIQNEMIVLKEQVIARQNTLNIVTGLLGLIALCFAVYLFVNFRRKKNLNIVLERKIRERTMELELSRDELLKTLREMNLRVKRASGFVTDSVNRIEGLCSAALLETPDAATHFYLRRINDAADAIPGGIHAFFNESDLVSA